MARAAREIVDMARHRTLHAKGASTLIAAVCRPADAWPQTDDARRACPDCAGSAHVRSHGASHACLWRARPRRPPEEPAAEREVSQGFACAEPSLKVLAPAPNSACLIWRRSRAVLVRMLDSHFGPLRDTILVIASPCVVHHTRRTASSPYLSGSACKAGRARRPAFHINLWHGLWPVRIQRRQTH